MVCLPLSCSPTVLPGSSHPAVCFRSMVMSTTALHKAARPYILGPAGAVQHRADGQAATPLSLSLSLSVLTPPLCHRSHASLLHSRELESS